MAFNTIEKLVSKFSSLRIRCCTSGLRWACLSHGPSLLLLQSACGNSAAEDELRLVVVRETGLAGECCSALRSSPSTCLCCWGMCPFCLANIILCGLSGFFGCISDFWKKIQNYMICEINLNQLAPTKKYTTETICSLHTSAQTSQLEHYLD